MLTMASHSQALLMMILAIAFMASGTSVAAQSCSQGDRDALLLVKESMRNPVALDSWDSLTDCCSDWVGIGCDDQGRVINVKVENIAVESGSSISPNIADLTALQILAFNQISNLSGQIPDNLSPLSSLVELYLKDNQLSGAIPSSIGELLSLRKLELDHNLLNGSLPDSMANLELTDVDLSHNKLSSGVEYLLGEEKPTETLSIASNEFYFNMSEVAFPLNLSVLDVSDNRAYSTPSSQLSRLVRLQFLNVSSNLLWGQIPSGRPSNFNAAFENNVCLCGVPLLACPCCIGNSSATRFAALFAITK